VTVATEARTKFQLKSHDDDTSKVFVVVGADEHHVGDLFFNGCEWLFVKLDAEGEIVTDSSNTWIDADPEQWAHLREMANENAKGREERNQAVNDALDAALALRRRQFRDDTRELAELGAKGKARAWWSMYRLWLQGCTGFYAEGGFRHDGDTCPVHEDRDGEDWQRDAQRRYDDDGRPISDMVTCGHCGRTWDDALITSRTPVPAGRCPFEDLHV